MSGQGKAEELDHRHAAGAGGFPGRESPWSPEVVAGLVRVGDLMILVATAVLAYLARFGTVNLGRDEMIVLVLIVPVGANVFHLAGVYRPEALADSVTQVRKTTLAWVATLLIVILLGYLTKTSAQYSRLWAGVWFILATMGLLASRSVLMAVLSRAGARGALVQRVALLAGADQLGAAREMAARLAGSGLMGVELAGIFLSQRHVQDDHEGVAGGMQHLLTRIEANGVDRVIAVLPWDDMEAIQRTVAPLRELSIEVDLAPPGVDNRLFARPVRRTLGVPAINLATRPLGDWDVMLKRAEDLLLAVAGLVVASPIMLLAAIAIRSESPGPILYRQRRAGFNGRIFDVYKFRSMYQEACGQPVAQATRDDPRVTRVGRALRRLSIDELPQLLNVLKGEMSLVGPRPHAVEHDEQFAQEVETYAARHRMKPGITGWAQVNGWRGDTDTLDKLRKRVEHDLFYIDNWSLWFDVRIIIMTLFNLAHRNAY